ncbi:SsrA-binding protein SmpB [Patescibacteria group bacterium]|nr:SsrA-binding protein SmpB [Patescibacteria group bacterium]MBU4023170.1 SsrA-binding protein SmpB [Patescibacteria group bacterium]MBU4078321.1 SsrA-binding protein SmpB [Patescibacteria group bacterium]
MKILAKNKKAYNEYHILEILEAGIVLTGQEVKSIKTGKANMLGSFVVLKGEIPQLLNTKIPAYQPKNAPADYDEAGTRNLLLTKAEIKRLLGKSKQKSLTIVPLRMYTKQSKIKVEIAVVEKRDKKDKREIMKKRISDRDIRRELKTRG